MVPPLTLARTHGPYYGNVDATPDALLKAVNAICTPAGKLVLLHANKNRLRLMINLIAQPTAGVLTTSWYSGSTVKSVST